MMTGMVCAFGLPVRMRAKMNSFQLTRKQKMPVATMPGRATGRMIFQIAFRRVQPIDQGRTLQIGRQPLEVALHHPGRSSRSRR